MKKCINTIIVSAVVAIISSTVMFIILMGMSGRDNSLEKGAPQAAFSAESEIPMPCLAQRCGSYDPDTNDFVEGAQEYATLVDIIDMACLGMIGQDRSAMSPSDQERATSFITKYCGRFIY